jgi:hypothetical protein
MIQITQNFFVNFPYFMRYTLIIHVRWVPCHHITEWPQVVDGGNSVQLCSVDANTLNKQPQTADKGWSSS